MQSPSPQVPEELRSTDYEFPRVSLPQSRPGATRQVLAQLGQADWAGAWFDDNPHVPEQPVSPEPRLPWERDLVNYEEMLNLPIAADDTQPLPVAGVVVDDTPQAAHHDGLTPAHAPVIPVPENPFLNAHPPRHASPAEPRPEPPTEVIVHVGNALPARLTAPELMLLGRDIPADAPAAVKLAATPPPYRPVQRDARHPLVFSAFDAEFWEQIDDVVRQQHAGAGGMRMSNDQAMDALMAHLARVDAAHKAGIDRVAVHEYAGRLADATRPLPHRTPGVALAAIEASRGELVAQ